jgi:hypothetical protein
MSLCLGYLCKKEVSPGRVYCPACRDKYITTYCRTCHACIPESFKGHYCARCREIIEKGEKTREPETKKNQ